MKWTPRKIKLRFAVLPHKCSRCDDIFWLEEYVEHTNSYGEVMRHCKDCAQFIFTNMREKKHD